MTDSGRSLRVQNVCWKPLRSGDSAGAKGPDEHVAGCRCRALSQIRES